MCRRHRAAVRELEAAAKRRLRALASRCRAREARAAALTSEAAAALGAAGGCGGDCVGSAGGGCSVSPGCQHSAVAAAAWPLWAAGESPLPASTTGLHTAAESKTAAELAAALAEMHRRQEAFLTAAASPRP